MPFKHQSFDSTRRRTLLCTLVPLSIHRDQPICCDTGGGVWDRLARVDDDPRYSMYAYVYGLFTFT